MNKDTALTVLRAAEPRLRSQGVAHVALFGSVARGDYREGSDIDVMVELEADVSTGVFGFVEIVNTIQDLFVLPVDVSHRESLRPFIRPAAERDAIYAF